MFNKITTRTRKHFVSMLAPALALAAMLLAQGCGGGGGSAPAASGATAISPGHGRISASVRFRGPSAGREAATTGTTVGVNIAITGVYSKTGEEFEPVTTHIDIDSATGYGQAVLIDVPIGINHVLSAIATYPDGTTEEVLAIVQEVVEGTNSSVAADQRSTVIAKAAIYMAEQNGETNLTKITPAQLEAIASTVDLLYASGTPYDEMSPGTILNYGEYADTIGSIDISPSALQIAPGETQQFAAVVKNIYGVEIASATVTWSADAAIGSIDAATGLFTAGSSLATGVVTATSGSTSFSAPVTITNGPAASIKILDVPGGAGTELTAISLTADDSHTFYAAGYDSTGAYIGDQNVSWSITPSFGTLSNNTGSSMTLNPSLVGAGTLTATLGGGVSASVQITITMGATVSVALTPEITPYGKQYDIVQFALIATDADSNASDVISIATCTASIGLMPWGGGQKLTRIAGRQANVSGGSDPIPGQYSLESLGAQSLSCDYQGLNATQNFEVIEADPYVSPPNLYGLNFGDPIEAYFYASGGTPVLTWALTGGIPPSVTVDPSTGYLSGYAPDYMGTWKFYGNVTDSLGRSTSHADPYNISDGEVTMIFDKSADIQEFINILGTADGALNAISDLLQQARSLAISTLGGGDGPTNDSNYQAILGEIDSVAATTSFNGTLTTNGSVLLDGSYNMQPIEYQISGGGTPQYQSINFMAHTSAALGLSTTSVIDITSASNTLPLIENAIELVSTSRAMAGENENIANLILDANNTAIMSIYSGDCLLDLYWLTAGADGDIQQVVYALMQIRSIVQTAAAGGLSTAEINNLQMQADMLLGFIDSNSQAAAFGGALLFDGNMSRTCSGAPTVTLPEVTVLSMGLVGLNVTTPGFTGTSETATIDAVLQSIADIRADVQSKQATIVSMIGYTP